MLESDSDLQLKSQNTFYFRISLKSESQISNRTCIDLYKLTDIIYWIRSENINDTVFYINSGLLCQALDFIFLKTFDMDDDLLLFFNNHQGLLQKS